MDSTAVQFKAGTGGESIQTEPDGQEGIPVSGLQITQTTNANCYHEMLQKLHIKIEKKNHLGDLNDNTPAEQQCLPSCGPQTSVAIQ
jgi:hypothetical protein